MAIFQTSFRFGTVAVIESLPTDKNEFQTGLWLHDTVLLPLAEQHRFKLLKYVVTDSVQLFAALAAIETAIFQTGHGTILHFETHGVKEGVQLASREIVPWQSLKASLTAINKGCRMNLLAVMGMCHGGHLTSLLQPTDIAPFWGLIGPEKEVYPCRLQEAFQLFYQELLGAFDGRAALQAMNARHTLGSWDLNIDTAELMFCRIFREYIRVKCTPEELAARENEHVAWVTRQFNYDLTHAINARADAKAWLADSPMLFEKYRHSFLMIDLFPENAGRFTISYDDCIETF
jgi:hypothetical protein